MSIVLIRLDKIGDLVASLPCDEHPDLHNTKIEWVIAEGLGVIAESAVPKRKFIELSLHKSKRYQSFIQLLNFLKLKKPKAVVLFYGPWWVGLACWLARVPLRVTRKSQWHSFLFFNKTLRQQRSHSEKHEADYNQELVEFGLGLAATKTAHLKLTANTNPHLLEKFNLQKNEFIIVHPGMFGSALNWTQDRYNELIGMLVLHKPVVITGTASDEKFLSEIKNKWQQDPRVRIAQGKLSMQDLLSMLSMCRLLVAPSTGVLHLAASLGKPCVGIYSSVTAHHPIRWGPRSEYAKVFVTKQLPAFDLNEIRAKEVYDSISDKL